MTDISSIRETTTTYKSPLSVHIMFHEEYEYGDETFNYIYSLLCRNSEIPQTDGMDIPVYRYKGSEKSIIPPIDLNVSDKIIIMPLITIEMYCDSSWQSYLSRLVSQVKSHKNCSILPISMCDYSFGFIKDFAENQMISLSSHSILDNKVEFQIRLFDNLIRCLTDSTKKLKVFISHSKRDKNKVGEIRALELRNFIRSKTKLDSFFDVNDIPDGRNFEEEIKNNIRDAQNSAIVIIDSTTYSEREWCRKEALEGKSNNVPAIRVDVLDGIVRRTFPYIANIPTIRFNDNWDEVVSLLLRSVLDQHFQQQFLEILKSGLNLDGTIQPTPPELISVHKCHGSSSKVIYPEPPLGREELALLKEAFNDKEFVTPMQLLSSQNDLKGKSIAISISEPDNLSGLPVAPTMMRDLSIEVARHLLVAGAKLVYGGDLRPDGMTYALSELTKQYGITEGSDPNMRYLSNYIAWPIYNNMTISEKAFFKDHRVDIILTSAPDGLADEVKNSFVPSNTPENKYLWAKSLTKMRTDMESGISARIVVGGRTSGFKGLMPGIMEEVCISMSNEHPIYIIGGFGGASKILVDCIEKNITMEEVLSKIKFNPELQKELGKRAEVVNMSFLDSLYDGVSNLNNGLDIDENITLFHSTNIIEIVALILKGIKTKIE